MFLYSASTEHVEDYMLPDSCTRDNHSTIHESFSFKASSVFKQQRLN